MKTGASITRRLTLSVLLLEMLASLVLIATVTNHERRVRFETFDANLRATANALLGAVQEADSDDGSIRLDLRSINVSPNSMYRVTADNGQLLGERGNVPPMPMASGTIFQTRLQGHPFRFYVLKGERVIDPNSTRAVNHDLTIVYGVPEGRTWHSVFEATQFFALATVILLGITAVIMSWLVRRFLRPIRELAQEAEKVDAENWNFSAPSSSKQFMELRPLAAAIETTIARLQRSFEQQRRFTSDAAHELKTDLAIVKSSVQLLTMKRRTVEEYEEGLALGLDDVARLETTVQKMLTLARLEQTPRYEEQQCKLVEAVKDAIAQAQSYARLKEVEIIVKTSQPDMTAHVSYEDAVLLCSNVLINAIQHSPEHSRIEIALTHGDKKIEMLIRDFGEGVADKDRPYIFDAFYRGDASRSRKSGGTGLGLSICKAICDRAGGSISITNHSMGGAEVLIFLSIGQTA